MTRIPGEVYEVRCGKCDAPSTMERCPHAYGDLQFCDCCSECRALCYEMGPNMFDMTPCTVDEELTKVLEAYAYLEAYVYMKDIDRITRGDST